MIESKTGADDHGAGIGAAPCALRRRLRVVIYARYSTEEQDASSITDQVAYCRDYLKTIGYGDADVTIIKDEAISGELRNRPGIDQIWEGIKRPAWDLLLCEDASRLFRNESACREMVDTAYDNDMRVICINDGVDTEEEGWDDRLRNAAHGHEKANHHLRGRIRRKLFGLWRTGAAVCMTKAGYGRVPTVPAAFATPAVGPFFDKVDEEWAPVVREAFQRIADGQPPWAVAKWLTARKLPKPDNSRFEIWTKKDTIALIRRPIYRGSDVHGVKVVKKKKRTGKKRRVWNDNNRWTRDMEHLRLVSDALWYKANAAIDARKSRQHAVRGVDHPLYGIERDSLGPLSKVFICGRSECGEKMYQDGRNGGGYRCKHARTGKCWNKATAVRAAVHAKLGQLIGDELLKLSTVVEPLVAYMQHLCANGDHLEQKAAELRKEEATILKQETRLRRLARSDDDPPASIVADLRDLEQQLVVIRAELEDTQRETQSERPEVTREQILEALRSQTALLVEMAPEAGVVLERLIPGKIRAVPYMQFGCTTVVLRAEFELHLLNFLPENLLAVLKGAALDALQWAKPIPCVIDLFTPSEVPKNAMKALALREQNPAKPMTMMKIAAALNISKKGVYEALRLGKKMRDAGITDPYMRLSEPPVKAARWRTHQRFLPGSDDREAG